MFDRLKLPSTKKALKRIIGASLMNEIMGKEPDWRLHFGMAASRLNLSEASLMKAISDILGLSWEGLQEPLPLPGRPEAPQTTRENSTLGCDKLTWTQDPLLHTQSPISSHLITTFLKQGAFPLFTGPLFTGTRLCGAICIDPSQLKHLLGLRDRRLIKVTSYGRLLSYTAPLLEQVNTNYHTHMSAPKTSANAAIEELPNAQLRQVFQLIATEAEAFNSASCIIVNVNNCLNYQFTTPEGEIAEGAISPNIRACLLDALNSCVYNRTRILLTNGKLIAVSKDAQSFQLVFHPSHTSDSLGVPHDNQNTPHILVLEDDQIFAKVTGLLLQDNGYSHSITNNPFEAISKLRSLKVPPLAILCDLQLTNSSGIEFIHTLRNDPQLKQLNIIALTSTEDPLPPLKAGADIFIRKSDGPELLITYLSRLKARLQVTQESDLVTIKPTLSRE